MRARSWRAVCLVVVLAGVGVGAFVAVSSSDRPWLRLDPSSRVLTDSPVETRTLLSIPPSPTRLESVELEIGPSECEPLALPAELEMNVVSEEPLPPETVAARPTPADSALAEVVELREQVGSSLHGSSLEDAEQDRSDFAALLQQAADRHAELLAVEEVSSPTLPTLPTLPERLRDTAYALDQQAHQLDLQSQRQRARDLRRLARRLRRQADECRTGLLQDR